MEEPTARNFIAEASDGHYVNISPRGCAMVGYREDELRRMNMKDRSPPGDPPPQLALLRGSARSIMLERRLPQQDGRLASMSRSARRCWRTGVYRSIVRDITQRKRAEEEMHKLSSAVEQTADSVR